MRSVQRKTLAEDRVPRAFAAAFASPRDRDAPSAGPLAGIAAGGADRERRTWVTPRVSRIVAGSAEAQTNSGQPDGGPVGQSFS